MSELYQTFYKIVSTIPRGHVLSYGEVARIAGYPRHARHVGFALAALKHQPDTTIPWHRVVNATGSISARRDPAAAEIQRQRLEDEGICFDTQGRIITAQLATNALRS